MRRGALSLSAERQAKSTEASWSSTNASTSRTSSTLRGLRHIRACATKGLVHLRRKEPRRRYRPPQHVRTRGRRSGLFYAIRRKRAFRCFGIFPEPFSPRIGRIVQPGHRLRGFRLQVKRRHARRRAGISRSPSHTSILSDLRSASIPAISSVSISGGAKSAVALRVRELTS